ncbi:MAG: cysteine desulfurase-like protein [Mariniblastus sp.]
MKFNQAFVDACREQFPALTRQENGQPVAFFDGPAGTQVPRSVAEAITNYLFYCNANRNSQFGTSRESDELLRRSHQAHAQFVGASDGDEIAFGQNMTSLTFSISRALGRTWNAGDEIIVTALDHDANISPWLIAAEEAGVKVHFVGYQPDDYTLDMADYAYKLNDKTRLVAAGCACNATGGINPVKQIAKMAHEVGAKVFLDAVHFGPHGLIDVVDWDCDFLGLSNYKFFGPHMGMLWGRRELLEELEPYKVRPASNKLPSRWMTGTQSHESIAGGMACIDYIADIGRKLENDSKLERRDALRIAFDGIVEYEKSLSERTLKGLQAIDGVEVFGITDPARLDERFPTFSIRHRTIPPRELAKALGEQGIYAGSGNYNALEFSTRLGFEPHGMVRFGLVHYNTLEEVDRLMVAIEQVISTAV